LAAEDIAGAFQGRPWAAHRGGTYDYFDVPEAVVRDFIGAPSLGQFVNWKIKPYYKYKRVG
jgi:KTSC domain